MINRMSRKEWVGGFTLIELMIVVAVIAVLAAIAFPSYSEHVRKSRRAQVKADLVEYAQLAERWHSANNSYVGFALPQTFSPREGGTVYYTLRVAPTQSTFTITATPQGAQTADKCGTLSVDQASGKSNSSGTRSECW